MTFSMGMKTNMFTMEVCHDSGQMTSLACHIHTTLSFPLISFFSSHRSTLPPNPTPSHPQNNMGCTPSRPHNTPPIPKPNSFHHAPKYPQVPPSHIPHDCVTCTHVNRKYEQRCGNACTATRRSKMRCKWNPGVHPRRHSWEVYEEETVW